MEQPRYRYRAGPEGSRPGGGSGTAWSGTCGHPRAATGATSPGTAGDDDDESGERDPPVPNPGGVPGPGSVPNAAGVPTPEGVPGPGGVPKSGDVPNPEGVPKPESVLTAEGVPNPEGVPNFGSVRGPEGVPDPDSITSSGSVPNPEGAPNPGSVPNPEGVPTSGGVPNTGNVPTPGSVLTAEGVPSPRGVSNIGSVPKPSSVPNPEGVPSPGNVASPGDVPNSKSVPKPRGVPNLGSVPSPGSVPNSRSVPTPGYVPTPGSVPNPSSVPSPGGRCSCRGPPAAPPSPSRDLPCGLGCRHRRPPEGTGDKTRRRQSRQRHEEEEEEEDTGDTSRGHLRVARAGVALSLRLLGALLALLFLLLLLLLGAFRSFLRGISAGLRRSRELLGEWLRHRASHSAVPKGGDEEEEVTRLVAMAEVAEEELDPFRVLGVEPTASDPELRRAYRRLAVLVHPDKSRDPRAEAAFKVLRAGWEKVSSPERRRHYQTKQLAQGELVQALGAFLGRLQEELRDARDAMGCTRCGGRHRRFQLDRDPRGARYCASCGEWHSAEEGDLWAESSLLGLKVTYLARMDGHIYDVTEWAGCQRVAISPDSHRVPYHLSFGARTATPAGRQRPAPKGSPPSSTDLQDFLARVFQGNPGWGEPGGAFPTPSGASGPPQGPPQAQGGPPRGDTKHKRRKKGRRPLPR